MRRNSSRAGSAEARTRSVAARPLAADRLCYAKTRDGRWTIVNFDQGQDD
jgi:hypothetical protein